MPSVDPQKADLGNAELTLNVARLFKFLFSDWAEELHVALGKGGASEVRGTLLQPG